MFQFIEQIWWILSGLTDRVPTVEPISSIKGTTSLCNVITANNANHLASHIILLHSPDKHNSLDCLHGADQIWQADYRAGHGLSLLSFLRKLWSSNFTHGRVKCRCLCSWHSHVWQLSLPVLVCFYASGNNLTFGQHERRDFVVDFWWGRSTYQMSVSAWSVSNNLTCQREKSCHAPGMLKQMFQFTSMRCKCIFTHQCTQRYHHLICFFSSMVKINPKIQ